MFVFVQVNVRLRIWVLCVCFVGLYHSMKKITGITVIVLTNALGFSKYGLWKKSISDLPRPMVNFYEMSIDEIKQKMFSHETT